MKLIKTSLLASLIISLAVPVFSQKTDPAPKPTQDTKELSKTEGLRKLNTRTGQEELDESIEATVAEAMKSVEVALKNMEFHLESLELNLAELDFDIEPINISIPELDFDIEPIMIDIRRWRGGSGSCRSSRRARTPCTAAGGPSGRRSVRSLRSRCWRV
jgi:hypothetical protein